METVESCLSFFDIVEVNEYKQLGFIDNFEQMREYLINIYREKNFVSTISLYRFIKNTITK